MSANIHKVPMEILCHIFVSLLFVGADYTIPLVLRLVCRHWQEVVEKTPEIWTVLIVHGGTYWTERALKLSKNMPLDVTLHAKNPEDECYALSNLVLSQLFRVRTLALRPGRIHHHILPFLRRSAPLLEALDIDGEWTNDKMQLKSAMCSPPPRLSVLRLAFVKTPPDLVFFQSPLTDLCLQHCHSWKTIDDVLNILSSLPRLEILSTVSTFHSDFTPQFRSTPKIQPYKVVALSQLKCFMMIEDLEPLGDVMPHITLPPNCCVGVVAEVLEDDGQWDKENILSALERVCRGHLDTVNRCATSGGSLYDGFENLEISDGGVDDSYCVELRVLWSTSPTSRFLGGSYQLNVSVPGRFIGVISIALEHMITAWAPAPDRLSYLHIHNEVPFENAEVWESILPFLSGIIELSITDCAVSRPIELMLQNQSLLPHMRRIRFTEVNLSQDEFLICIDELMRRRTKPFTSHLAYYISLSRCILDGGRCGHLEMRLEDSVPDFEDLGAEGFSDG